MRKIDTPAMQGGRIVAGGTIDTSCRGTFGCWTYIKLERKAGLADRLIGSGWQYASGAWATDNAPAVSILPRGDCSVYRTTIESYYAMPARPLQLHMGLITYSLNVESSAKMWRSIAHSEERELCSD